MAPETYSVSISPLFFDQFKATNGVQSNETYVQILHHGPDAYPHGYRTLNTGMLDLGKKYSK